MKSQDEIKYIVSRDGPSLPTPPTFPTLALERQYRKEQTAAAFRTFALYGFDEGIAGHITTRDPEYTDTFWVNPFGWSAFFFFFPFCWSAAVNFPHSEGMDFSLICANDLVRVNHKGEIVEGHHPVNGAAFAIHSAIHKARPDVVTACHAHSIYGKTWVGAYGVDAG